MGSMPSIHAAQKLPGAAARHEKAVWGGSVRQVRSAIALRRADARGRAPATWRHVGMSACVFSARQMPTTFPAIVAMHNGAKPLCGNAYPNDIHATSAAPLPRVPTGRVGSV